MGHLSEKLQFNIVATIGTTETSLIPYPGGSEIVPNDKYRKIYVIILNNSASATNTLTLNIYKGVSLESSLNIVLNEYSLTNIVSNSENPILIIPPGRTLKAVASSESVNLLMAGVDE